MRARLLIGWTLMLAASAGSGADTYRWVDEKGVTNYGDKAPDNRASRPVDTRPQGTIEGGAQIRDLAESERQRAADEARRAPTVPMNAPLPVAARGMDFDVYIRLYRGMTEGELLIRAGPPDYQSVDNLVDYDRSFYYFPTLANPFTTVVKLRGGRIAYIDRIKKF
jgi:Domain of unknown function (DUF4124)